MIKLIRRGLLLTLIPISAVLGSTSSLIKEIEIKDSLGITGNAFIYPSEVEADSQGNIYILESGETRIQVFDRNGRFLKSLGKKGQGPGEFQSPVFIRVSNNDELYVVDITRRCISVFTRRMEFKKNITFPSHILVFNQFEIDRNDDILCGYAPLEDNIDQYIISKYDNNFVFRNTVIRFKNIASIIRLKGLTIRPLSNSPAITWTLSENGYVYSCRSDEGLMFICDLDGAIVQKTDLKYEKKNLSNAEKDLLLKSWNPRMRSLIPEKVIPKIRPLLRNIKAVGKDIFILKEKLDENRFAYDVWKGVLSLKESFILPIRIASYKNGKAYTIEFKLVDETKDLEDMKISRYSLDIDGK